MGVVVCKVAKSVVAVDRLKLKAKPHPKPYCVAWVKKDIFSCVTKVSSSNLPSGLWGDGENVWCAFFSYMLYIFY